LNNLPDLLLIGLGLATPLIFAVLGGYFSERSGVINIGLEGMMLSSACATALVGVHHGPLAGLAAGILVATLLSVLHWVATQIYRIDHVISGMAVNAIAAGATNFANGKFATGSSTVTFSEIPFQVGAMVLAAGVAFMAVKTRFGLRLTAVGADPGKARLAGINPPRTRLWALLATGILTGLAGSYLVTETGVFTDNMTAGKGYIALAALILAGWRPIPSVAAALAFGLMSGISLKLQGQALGPVTLPEQFWTAAPYTITVIALAGFGARQRTPAGLGKF
jgi:simple sugar transport system permease protein